jgi:transcriptional regulator with XRE-family HTH domain
VSRAGLLGDVAARIRLLRERRGMRPAAMAAELGWRRWQWERLEVGDRDLQISTLATVADALGVSLSELLRGV